MPKPCGLCTHVRRGEVDPFLAQGTTFKQFRAKFRGLRNISIATWSRHRNHIPDSPAAKRLDAEATAAQDAEFNAASIVAINRRLKILAKQAEKTGRTSNAIACYVAMGRNAELLARSAPKGKDGASESPRFNIVFRGVEEVEAARLAARQVIAEQNPAFLEELDAAEIAPDVAAQAAEPPAVDDAAQKNIAVWENLGKRALN
jgi:hypothetical protein